MVADCSRGIRLRDRLERDRVESVVRPVAGVRRVYGVSGDSLDGITDAIRVKKQLLRGERPELEIENGGFEVGSPVGQTVRVFPHSGR